LIKQVSKDYIESVHCGNGHVWVLQQFTHQFETIIPSLAKKMRANAKRIPGRIRLADRQGID
jgi:hypothetical protein